MTLIQLNQINKTKNYKKHIALVDDDDSDRVNMLNWCFDGRYVRASLKGKMISLHNFILNFPNKEIDHINRDAKDNRKENLRVVGHSINTINRKLHISNTSGYRGVTYHKNRNTWQAVISKEKKHYYIGNFKTAHYAALAYDLWAKDIHREFAQLNFVQI